MTTQFIGHSIWTLLQQVLHYVKDKIPANKLSLGVPLYYWKWNADTNKRVGSGFFKMYWPLNLIFVM